MTFSLTAASWNVNSLRARLEHLLKWLEARQPDLVALQETKLEDSLFPFEALQELGYGAVSYGQKGYNGVALLSREPLEAVATGLPGAPDGSERRLIAATVGEVRAISVYVPNGSSIQSGEYARKLEWLQALTAYLKQELARHPRLLLMGDFNIAPEERDVYDPRAWQERVMFTGPERVAFARLLELGLVDTLRLFNDSAVAFTWWDYQMQAFKRNHGLRIDHILAGSELARHCRAAEIDRAPRGWPQPSDHTPVIARFS